MKRPKKQYNKKLTTSDLIFILFDGNESTNSIEEVSGKLADWIIYYSASLPSNFNKKSFNTKYEVLYEIIPLALKACYEEDTEEMNTINQWYCDYEKELIEEIINYLEDHYDEYDDEDDYWTAD